MSNIIRVAGAALDTVRLTMWLENGETMEIPQGDPRIQEILDLIMPFLDLKETAEFDLDDVCAKPPEVPEPVVENSYKDFEEKSGGLVRFFKVAKAKVAEFFSKLEEPEPVKKSHPQPFRAGQFPVKKVVVTRKPDASPLAELVQDVNTGELELPTVPVGMKKELPLTTPAPAPWIVQGITYGEWVAKYPPSPPVAAEVLFDSTKPTENKTTAAVAEIMKHAQPVTDKAFIKPKQTTTPTEDAQEEDTVIAVVDGKIIPGIERIQNQLDAVAIKLGSQVGVTKFLQRLAGVIDKRRHSIDDLLRFMSRGDLQIADDGCIVIYKVLRRKTGHSDTYVDCHSKKVTQRVGSYVHMDEAMVDPSQRDQCSNGLHVARRQYVAGFSGDVCVIAKVAPEDVIAVPNYEADKMRVCGYHILFELPMDAYDKLKARKAITGSPVGEAQLGKALSGNHVGVLEMVKINGQYGTNVVITSVADETASAIELRANEVQRNDRKAAPLACPDDREDQEKPALAAPVDPRKVVAKSAEAKELGLSTRVLRARELAKAISDARNTVDEIEAAKALLAYKQKAKVSWFKLGIDGTTVSRLETLMIVKDGIAISPPSGVEPVKVKAAPTLDEVVKSKATPAPVVKETPVKQNDPETEVKPPKAAATKRTQKDEALHLWDLYQKNPDRQNARALVLHKTKSKKSWTFLGLSNKIGKRMIDKADL